MYPSMEAQRKRERLILFIGLSLLAHFLLMLGLYRADLSRELKIPDNTVFVDLDKAPPPQQAAQPEKEERKQVVESEAAEQAKPDKANYLGERDQKVEKETKAKQVDSFRKGGSASKTGQGGKPSLALKDLAPKHTSITPPTQAEIDGFREQIKKMAKQEHSTGGPEGADSPGSATNDYLKDVKEGDRTLLNTKEFVYFSYYRRIRERLEVAWNSKLRSTLDTYVYGGRTLASRNYVTQLTVVLDRYGKITKVKVRGRSGARDLDDAAVGAFNEAGPFPDPPAGLVDANGEIQIPWDFILQS